MDYEKKYSEAVLRADEAVQKGCLDKDIFDIIFPPEESEDERIRKWILEKVQGYADSGIPCSDEIQMANKALSWLEEQKDKNCLACDQHLKGYIAGRKVTEEEKPMNLDLEIEIEDYVEQKWQFIEDLNTAVPVYLYDMTLDELKDCARHFAKWQAEQDKETIELAEEHALLAGRMQMKEEMGKEQLPLPEDTVLFNKGVEEGKRLMMEEAVEGEVEDVGVNYIDLIDFDAEKLGLVEGDKVRVIVCKKEEQQ